MSDPVLLEFQEHVALLTLNVPEKRNAFTPELIELFPRKVEAVAQHKDARVLVVTGAGKGFCSGADFATLPALASGTGLEGALAVHGAIEQLYAAFTGLDRLSIPTLAAVNGAAVGGGLGVALHCDIRIVAEDAKVGVNFAKLGIHPGLAITEILLREIGYQAAAELFFTGRLLRGREATELGLFREALPAADVLPRALTIAREIATAAPLSVKWIKRTLRSAAGWRLEETMKTEALTQALLAQSRDAGEGVAARMARREPRFKGV